MSLPAPLSIAKSRITSYLDVLTGKLSKWVNIAGVTLAIGWMLALLVTHIKVIAQVGPQEYNEPAIWQATWLLDHGRNPYAIPELPGSAYCFGPLYNYVVIALSPIFGIDYTGHRMVVLLFLVASMYIMARLMLKAGVGLGITLMSMALYYWMCLGNIMISARPDTLGAFLFLLSIFVPWEANYTRKSMVISLICSILAYHCKAYFAVAGCASLLCMFMLKSKKEAIVAGCLYFPFLFITFAVCCYLYPFYFDETILVQQGAAGLNSSNEISLMHTTMLFERAWPYIIVLLYGLFAWIYRRHVARRTKSELNPSSAVRFYPLVVVLLIFTALVYFYMGHNAGAYFTYHIHLLFPFFFIFTAYIITRPIEKIIFGLGLGIFLMYTLSIPDVPESVGPYQRMLTLIYNTPGEVLGIPCETDIFERTSRPVLHNGNTMFLGFLFGKYGSDPKVTQLAQRYENIVQEVENKVKNKQYLLVFTEFDTPMFCDPDILKANYSMIEQIDYYTYFGHSPVRVWKPKH